MDALFHSDLVLHEQGSEHLSVESLVRTLEGMQKQLDELRAENAALKEASHDPPHPPPPRGAEPASRGETAAALARLRESGSLRRPRSEPDEPAAALTYHRVSNLAYCISVVELALLLAAIVVKGSSSSDAYFGMISIHYLFTPLVCTGQVCVLKFVRNGHACVGQPCS